MYIYYVYAYLRQSDGTPYYIGKGKDKRAFSKRHPGISVPNDKTKIVFLETNLSNIGALALERRMIRWYGRKNICTGILYNKSEGGEGACGPRGPMPEKDKESKRGTRGKQKNPSGPRGLMSEETKQKMRKPHGPMSEEQKELRRVPKTEEHKQKLRYSYGPRKL